jgi:succinate dehydrogenase / fumarate reductase iron-sulfur subunit
MQFTLKIQRYDPDTEQGRLQEFTVDAPETATLLDVLDVVKDTVDGSVTYRKSCRMAVCGSCGMRMDGAAVLACKAPMAPLAESGHVPVISPMGNLPVIKDLVVDIDPFWAKFKAVKPWLGDDRPPVKVARPAGGARPDHEGGALHPVRCCVSECNSMESDPDFLGPAALAKAQRFVGDVRDRDRSERLRTLNGPHGVWDCTRCYFCQERCPKGVDPRDAIAKLGAEIYSEGMLSDKGARHAQVFDMSTRHTGYLLETALVPYTDPLKALDVKFAMSLARAGKVPNPLKPHRAKKLGEVRKLHKLLKAQEAEARDKRRSGVSVDREETAE